MKTDGRTETYAFTEVDNSFSGGLLIKGGQWSRPEDSIGLSFMQNQLSSYRRKYLEGGGISFFIGDGSMSYKPENIAECFYSFGVYKNTWLTADYQRISNPAYNASRGPVSVYAFRLHAEF
jgi:carbohydrate-selective porin OprB